MSTVQSGAAYEAVLVDKVSGKVDQIVASLDQLKAAFKELNGPASQVNANLGGVATALRGMEGPSKRASKDTRNMAAAWRQASTQISMATQAIGQSMIHVGHAIRNAGAMITASSFGILAALNNMVRTFADSEEMADTFSSAFRESTQEMSKWTEELAKTAGRSSTEIKSAAIRIRGLFKAMGLTEGTLNDMTKAFVESGLDLAHYGKGMPDEQAFQDLISGLNNSAEVLDKFNVNVREMNVKKVAKELGFIEDMGTVLDEATKKATKAYIFAEAIKEMGIAGSRLREFDSYTSNIKRFTTAIEELKKSIGRTLIADATMFLNAFKNLAEVLQSTSPHIVSMIAGVAVAGAVLGPVLMAVGSAIAVAGVAFLALGSAIVGVITVIAGLALANPIVGSIAAVLVAAAVSMGVAMYRAFDLAKAVGTLRLGFERLAQTVGLAAGGISNALKAKDIELAWEIFKTSGEIAARDFGQTLKRAMISGFADALAFLAEMGSRVVQEITRMAMGMYGKGTVKSEIFHDAQAFGGRSSEEKRRYSFLKQKLEELLAVAKYQADQVEETAQSPASDMDAAIRAMLAEMMGRGSAAAQSVAREIMSTGGFAAGFAGRASQFAPVMSGIEDNQREQINLQKEQNRTMKNVDSTLNKMAQDQLVFG